MITIIVVGKKIMFDLHCHILPGIDDGAKNLEISLELLKMEQEQGITNIAFTPHFKIDQMTLEEFLVCREQSKQLLYENSEFKTLNLNVKSAAEVYFSLELLDIDLEPLCYEGTDYILIELPVTSKPYGLESLFTDIINQGFTPVIAHVERYPYFAENPVLLYDLVMQGCLAHINADTIIKKGSISKIAMKYLKWELIHFICSDCHSVEHRPPNIKKAYDILKTQVGDNYIDWLINNSKNIFNGKFVNIPVIKKPKKVLGFWV